jgi:hypothetical protein
MKKAIFGLLFFVAVSTTASAQTQDTTGSTKYWYYPSNNVYMNGKTNEYWYYDASTSKWTSGKTLPSTINLNKSAQHYDVYYKGSDVWMDNKTHMSTYNKSNGTQPQMAQPQTTQPNTTQPQGNKAPQKR